MPKIKTRKAIAKRFKVTKSGKLKPLGSSFTSHIMSKKDSKRRRRLRSPELVKGSQAKSYKRMMGQ